MPSILAVALPVFAVITAGLAAGRLRLAGAEDSAALNRFVFRFAMPAALFGLMSGASGLQSADGWLALSYVAPAMLAAFAGYQIGRRFFRLKRPDAGAHAFASSMGNAVFLGLPIALAIEEWDRVFNINLRANMLLMKHFIPALKAADGAAIVTVSSWYGKSGHGFFGAYCASKAGLISLTHTAADELSKDKIRVNTVAPGNVATSMHLDALTEEAEKRGITFEEMKKIEWDKIPLERAAYPSEIADAINFLAGPDSNYITGATIDVNGGCLFS